MWNFAWHGVPNMPLMKRLNRWTLRIGIRSRKKHFYFFFNQWKGIVSPATVGAEHRKPHWASALYLRRVQLVGIQGSL